MITANFQERNLCTALSGKKNPARGPYRKKLDRSRARDQPIKFEDLGIRPAQMLEKKIITAIFTLIRSRCATHLIQSVSHSTQSIFHSIQFTVHADSSWSSKIINCPFNFTPISVTIFSVFWQKSCYRLTNAANFRPPLTFDASWCERRESNSHKGRLDPVLQDVTQP